MSLWKIPYRKRGKLRVIIFETATASRFLWACLALFIFFGLGYSTLTPIFENSDETLHYPYAKNIADGQGLPLAVPGQLWQQEGTQHPLYYTIVAATTFWIDTDNLADHLRPNPHWLFSEVRALINDNQNVVLHGPMDQFPYRRAALAIHVGRWWSLTFGLITVVCTFLIGRHLFPDNLPVALTATTLAAFTPQFIRVSTTVSNDSLSAALTSLAVWLAFLFTATPANAKGRPNTGWQPWPPAPWILGIVGSLALLTKLSSLTAALLISLIILWRFFVAAGLTFTRWKLAVRWLAIIGLVMVVSTGWWFIRNYQQYGEWLATETHLNLAGRSQLSLGQVWGLRTEIQRAYWATFGWGQIRPPEWIYTALIWFTRLGLIGLIVTVGRRLIRLQPGANGNLRASDLDKIGFLIVWAGLNAILYVRWVMAVGSVSHTRLVFPAITAIGLLLALGWHTFVPQRLAIWFSGLMMALMIALNVYSLGWLIYPAFQPDHPAQAKADDLSPIHATFLNRLTLTGGQVYPQGGLPDTPKSARRIEPGQVVIVQAAWQVGKPLDKNYSIAASLLAPDGSVLAQRETYPGLGLRPTAYLKPQTTFTDRYPLKLDRPVTQPLVARAAISLFDFDSTDRAGLPALDATGRPITPFVGHIKIVPKPWPDVTPGHTTDVSFNDALRLTGYDLTADTLTLYWQSQAVVEQDYVVFLHLLDAEGNTVAQLDGPPTQNAYPTSWWAPGEIIADARPLPDLSGGTTFRLGLYQLDTGQRLPITKSSLPHQDHAVEITAP